ncbi:MAG: xanthine dehydrogenase family protein molybdopterin-binding subunit [Acidobacteria bacterium]|nr:xanthine dehydrogenase family protein molybdopterin-binding subunit [Acidobacteriota bacterium]MCA1627549.1 xanthine dehydrogenase family protein molybdopterin-binding subunit [Acidobacteriota bacterium]
MAKKIMPDRSIGKSFPRKEGRKKVAGQALYIDDLTFPGLLHGVTVRSPVARGRIKNISFEGDIPWDEFTLVTAKDIPGANYVALILNDQPYLAAEFVNHPEEPVLLIAHENKYLVEEARRNVRIEIEEQPAVFTLEDALAKKEIIWGEDNTFKRFLVDKGDVDAAWANAAFIVEGEYETGAQEQLYIENNGAIAIANANEGVTVWGSMQCPYYVHKALLKLFDLPGDKIRVIQTETGGGFGGKEEYPSLISGHAALLAWKSGKPVKLIYDRAEDMVATTKRHPSRTRHKTAVTKDGKLLAMEIEFVVDGGAYCTLSPVVLSRGTIHSAGPYLCPNVRIRSQAVATNVPPHGAFRGFGAPQSIFALERHIDHVAHAVGLSPEEFRRRNFIREGETTATSQIIRERVDMNGLLDRALRLTDYHAKRERFAQQNGNGKKRGIGFATFMHGAGFTGSGEVYLQSVVSAEATAEGKVRILTASTEIGQGTNTIFSQIAAEALGLDFESIEIVQPDTGLVPNSGPTVASRTSMVVGKLVESAVTGLKQTLIGAGLLREVFAKEHFKNACAEYISRFGTLKTSATYQPPPNVHWDDEKYQGDAYGAYAWAVYVAEVSFDQLTYEAHVEDFVAVQEVGRVINPVLAAGQIEGGVAQAIGFTLFENVVWKDGRMANNQMTNYIIPTAADIPPIRVYFEENPYAYGPGGAKGIGELPMDGAAPAILNAIENATGVSFNRVPLMPEMLMEKTDHR